MLQVKIHHMLLRTLCFCWTLRYAFLALTSAVNHNTIEHVNCTASGLHVTSTTPIWITKCFNHVFVSFALNIHLQFHECTTLACLLHFQTELFTITKMVNQTSQCYPCLLCRAFETTCQRVGGILQIETLLCHIHGKSNYRSLLCCHLSREENGMRRRNRKSTRNWSICNTRRLTFKPAISFNQSMCMFQFTGNSYRLTICFNNMHPVQEFKHAPSAPSHQHISELELLLHAWYQHTRYPDFFSKDQNVIHMKK